MNRRRTKRKHKVENEKEIINPWHGVELPLKYDERGQFIVDQGFGRIMDLNDNEEGKGLAQLRGWGRLIGRGALNLEPETAEKIQDLRGTEIVRILNEALCELREGEDLNEERQS